MVRQLNRITYPSAARAEAARRGAILQMGLAGGTMLESGGDVSHFEKTRRRQNIITKLRCRRHEQIHGDAEIQLAQGRAGLLRIGIGQHRIAAKSQERFDRVGAFFENCGEDVIGGAVAGRSRRSQRFAFAADANCRGFFGQEFFAANIVDRNFWKRDVAALAIEVAKQSIQRGDGAAGLGRVGVLAKTVPAMYMLPGDCAPA